MATEWGMHPGEVLELERVALNGKQEHTSQAVALSLKQLHKDNPLVKIIVSYSDHRQKHIGTIYQATNWIYIGTINGGPLEFLYKGRWRHARSVSGNYMDLQKIVPSRHSSCKFKYLFCFDKKIRKRLLKLAKPYPKSEQLTESDEGGLRP